MTSPAVTERNRTNAKRSTGPKTLSGREAVSGNAHKHGATSQPDPASVAAWTRVILDRPDLAPADFFDGNPRVAAALTLAEAEVRLLSATASLDELERGEAAPSGEVLELQGFAADIIDEIREGTVTAKERRSGLSILRRIEKTVLKDTAPGGNRHLLLKRYLREARGRRGRAFEAWLECLRASDGGVEALG